ncbi:MAG: ribose 5-phosphate isomerase B [Caldiserica bacterium]|nr:ribose 5-phosphate isomerase B [Caldisericota bacterium]
MDDKIIGIASDHAGFPLKEFLKGLLVNWDYKVVDLGCNSEDSVDYPDFAYPLARKVTEGKIPRGILICGTGIGMSIAANKVKGIRAALCWDECTARMSRNHNDANILCLGGRTLTPKQAEQILKVWLEESFLGGNHKRRLDKISKIERDG